MSSEQLMERIQEFKLKRREGKISAREFYTELLNLTIHLAQELKDENISDEDIKKQIPLILVFLEEQVKKMKDRGG
jgi:hypothetical protein